MICYGFFIGWFAGWLGKPTQVLSLYITNVRARRLSQSTDIGSQRIQQRDVGVRREYGKRRTLA